MSLPGLEPTRLIGSRPVPSARTLAALGPHLWQGPQLVGAAPQTPRWILSSPTHGGFRVPGFAVHRIQQNIKVLVAMALKGRKLCTDRDPDPPPPRVHSMSKLLEVDVMNFSSADKPCK
ncbi:hypothetical protein B0H11DRAFT_1928635 [Mycena galericulata]|nr:hypothetical protein B0H11DRAFT_1928635 [Mycena galericulata]